MDRKTYQEITGAVMVKIEGEKAIVNKQWLVEKIANKYLEQIKDFEVDILEPVEIDLNINYDLIVFANILTDKRPFVVDIERLFIVDENDKEYPINYKFSEIEEDITEYLNNKIF